MRLVAVHQGWSAHGVLAAKGVADGLVTEADAENWYFAGELADDLDANAGVLRLAGAGRDHDALRFFGGNLIDRNLVVAANFESFA